MRFSFYCKLFLCCLILLVGHGCTKDGNSSKKRLAFITNNASDFWTIAQAGCEQAAKEIPDIEVDFRIPSDGAAAEQRRIVDDLLAKGIAGIAISPVDPGNQTQMLNDAAAKAVVMTQDSDAPGSNRVCYIGTDNRGAGRQAGGLIKLALPNGGRIMIFVGKLDVQNAQERYQGIKEALQGSNIEIIDVRTDDHDQVRAGANAADTLVKYPNIAGMMGLWSYNGPAILNAVKDAGKVGQVKIVCFDEDDRTLAGVKDGAIYGTVVQQPYEFGYQAIHMLSKIVRGDNSVIPVGKQKFIQTQIVNKDNAEVYIAKINKLRGRS